MCTVTYVPITNNRYILTHSRDENVNRPAPDYPAIHSINTNKVLLPMDTQSKGTWLACSTEYTCCILNGGFSKHISKPPYKKSRGKIIFDFYMINDVDDFVNMANFEDIEPFTLLIIENKVRAVHEIVWHENNLAHSRKDATIPHIWSSSTLYTQEQKVLRTSLFTKFINNEELNYTNLVSFHKDKYKVKGHEGFVINRDNTIKTLTIASVACLDTIKMRYFDLQNSTYGDYKL